MILPLSNVLVRSTKWYRCRCSAPDNYFEVGAQQNSCPLYGGPAWICSDFLETDLAPGIHSDDSAKSCPASFLQWRAARCRSGFTCWSILFSLTQVGNRSILDLFWMFLLDPYGLEMLGSLARIWPLTNDLISCQHHFSGTVDSHMLSSLKLWAISCFKGLQQAIYKRRSRYAWRW